MNRDQKVKLVSEIKRDLTSSDLVVLLHYRGLSDNDLYNFRKALKKNEANLKIAKNTLIKVAIKDTDLEILDSHLVGPTALAYAKDSVGLAKVISEASKSNEVIDIKIGYLNKGLIAKSAIEDLSKLGSLSDVRSSFVGLLKGSQSRFVRTLNASPIGIVNLLNNYSSKKEG